MPESSSSKDRIRRAIDSVLAGADVESVVSSLIEETAPEASQEAEWAEQAEAQELDLEAQAAQAHFRLTIRRAELEVRKSELENRRIELKNEQIGQNRLEREKYAKKIYRIVVSWLLCVGALLFFEGFSSGVSLKFFALPASVLITAMGTTTASVLGIFLIVTSYLFPSPGRVDKQKTRKSERPPTAEG